jgi:hypothetical protein
VSIIRLIVIFVELTILALVTRVASQNFGGLRLKAAAAYAESGEIHDTVKELWTASGAKKKKALIDKVSFLEYFSIQSF